MIHRTMGGGDCENDLCSRKSMSIWFLLRPRLFRPPDSRLTIFWLLLWGRIPTICTISMSSKDIGSPNMSSLIHFITIYPWWHQDIETLCVLRYFVEIRRSPVDSLHKGPIMWSFGVFVSARIMRSYDVFFDVTVIKAAEETVELPVIRDAMTLMWRHCNVRKWSFKSFVTI